MVPPQTGFRTSTSGEPIDHKRHSSTHDFPNGAEIASIYRRQSKKHATQHTSKDTVVGYMVGAYDVNISVQDPPPFLMG